MARLYDLTDAYASLIALLEDCTSSEEEQVILDQLSGINDSIGDKAEAYARMMQNLLSDIAGFKAEIDRLSTLKKRLENRVERLTDNIRYAMEIAGATELRTSIGAWKLKLNPPKVEITDAALIPEAYLKPQPPEIDKRAILAAYRNDGELIPGTEIVRKEVAVFK